MSQFTPRTGPAVMDAIIDAASPDWLAALDDTDLARASRPELLALLSSAPSAVAAGFLTGVIVSRSFL